MADPTPGPAPGPGAGPVEVRTLVDTSAWIEHLAKPSERIAALAETDEILVHPFVFGELALGSLKRRTEILDYMRRLEWIVSAGEDEVLDMVERFSLHGRGIGWVDCHLMASARIAGAELLTLDKNLQAAWRRLG